MYRTATEDYRRAVTGAFAFTHHQLLRRWGCKLQITVTEVDARDPYHGFVGHGYYTPLRVDVTVPWGRDDPRGMDRQSMRTVFFRATPAGRLHSRLERTPCDVGTVIPLDLTPTELTFHATVAAHRMRLELDRGYALIRQTPPPPDTIRADRKLLTERAWSTQVGAGIARILAETEPEWEEVDGELVDEMAGLRTIVQRETVSFHLWADTTGYHGDARDLPEEAWADERRYMVWADYTLPSITLKPGVNHIPDGQWAPDPSDPYTFVKVRGDRIADQRVRPPFMPERERPARIRLGDLDAISDQDFQEAMVDFGARMLAAYRVPPR